MNGITNVKPTSEHIMFADMIMHADLQMRGSTAKQIVKEYIRVFNEHDGRFNGKPPIVVRERDNGRTVNWLADGYHRREAGLQADAKSILCDVYEGDFALARLLAASANHDHGLPRSPKAKRASIAAFHEHPEWRKKGVREIARAVGCSHSMVQRWREETGFKLDTVDVKRTNKKTGKVQTYQARVPASTGSYPSQRDGCDAGDGTDAESIQPADPILPVEPSNVPSEPASERLAADGLPASGQTPAIRDASGNDVPANLRAVFAYVDELRISAKHVQASIRKWYEDAKSHAGIGMVNESEIEALAKNFYSATGRKLPYAVCGYCNGTKIDSRPPGKPGPCSCRRGWLDEFGAEMCSQLKVAAANQVKELTGS